MKRPIFILLVNPLCMLLASNLSIADDLHQRGSILQDIKCDKEHPCNGMEILQKKIDADIAMIEKTCAIDKKKCTQLLSQSIASIYRRNAVCSGELKDCRSDVNARMESLEQELLDNAKCAENTLVANTCRVMTASIEARKSTGKRWCDQYPDYCRQASEDRKERIAKYQDWLQKVKEKQKQGLVEKKRKEKEFAKESRALAIKARKESYAKYQEEVHLKQREFDEKYLLEKFRCIGNLGKCIAQINQFMSNLYNERAKVRCQRDKSICGKNNIATLKKNWCDLNADVCKKVRKLREQEVQNEEKKKHG